MAESILILKLCGYRAEEAARSITENMVVCLPFPPPSASNQQKVIKE